MYPKHPKPPLERCTAQNHWMKALHSLAREKTCRHTGFKRFPTLALSCCARGNGSCVDFILRLPLFQTLVPGEQNEYKYLRFAYHISPNSWIFLGNGPDLLLDYHFRVKSSVLRSRQALAANLRLEEKVAEKKKTAKMHTACKWFDSHILSVCF